MMRLYNCTCQRRVPPNNCTDCAGSLCTVLRRQGGRGTPQTPESIIIPRRAPTELVLLRGHRVTEHRVQQGRAVLR